MDVVIYCCTISHFFVDAFIFYGLNIFESLLSVGLSIAHLSGLFCSIADVSGLFCPVADCLSCLVYFVLLLIVSGLICPIADYPVRFVLSDSSRVSVVHGEYNGRTCIERQLGRLEMPYSQFCGGLCGGGSLAI